MLDAGSGLRSEAEKAEVSALKCLAKGDKLNADGFKERATNLKKLAKLLEYSNANYRAEIDFDPDADNEGKQIEGVSQMKEADAGEIIHLFEILQKHDVLCSLEFKSEGTRDPLFEMTDCRIELVEYFVRSGGPDSILLELDKTGFNFELGMSFFKDISDYQICICIADTHISAFFSSKTVPDTGIEEARSYVAPVDNESEDKEVTLDVHSEEYEDAKKWLTNLMDEGRVIKKVDAPKDGLQVLTVGYLE